MRASVPGRLAYSMRALGREDLPARLAVSGRTLRLLETAKHDFWAATGFYEDGLITADDFRDFTFANAVRLWGTCRPGFFDGTLVEKAAAAVLAETPGVRRPVSPASAG